MGILDIKICIFIITCQKVSGDKIFDIDLETWITRELRSFWWKIKSTTESVSLMSLIVNNVLLNNGKFGLKIVRNTLKRLPRDKKDSHLFCFQHLIFEDGSPVVIVRLQGGTLQPIHHVGINDIYLMNLVLVIGTNLWRKN